MKAPTHYSPNPQTLALCGEKHLQSYTKDIDVATCEKCIDIYARQQVESELHAAGIIDDPDMYGGLLD